MLPTFRVQKIVAEISGMNPTPSDHSFRCGGIVQIAAHRTMAADDDLALHARRGQKAVIIVNFDLLVRKPIEVLRPSSIQRLYSTASRSGDSKHEKLVTSERP